MYNPTSGWIGVWRDGSYVLNWTDTTPLTSGSYVALRTTNGPIKFDNLRLTGDKNNAAYNVLTYVYGDHLGSTTTVSDSAGQIIERMRFYPFGGYRLSDGSLLTEHGFTGHAHNDYIKLIYMGARWYDTAIGRFISADIIVPDPHNPQSFNRYSYALQNPLKYVDPTGHYACEYTTDCEPFSGHGADPRDLTYWIVREANYLPLLPEGEAIVRGLEPWTLGNACLPCSYYLFNEMAADGAPLDVKDAIEDELGKAIQLGGLWFEWSTAGNILFGFYGAAWDLTPQELHIGAAGAQIADWLRDSSIPLGPVSTLGDTTDDFYAVKFGTHLYNQGYLPDGEITPDEFTALITSYEHLDQMALQQAPGGSLQNSNWPYWQGYFYNDKNPPFPASLFPGFAD